MGQALQTLRVTHEREHQLRAASGFLDVVALWPAEDLDRRLGTRAQGPWLLTIQRPHPYLYRVGVADSTNGKALIATVLFRPTEAHATR